MEVSRVVLTAVLLCCMDMLWLGEACVMSCQCTMVGSKGKQQKGRKVECSKRPVPFTSLAGITFPMDTVHLDLKKNALTILKQGSFMELSGLQKLNLSYNQITILEPGAFEGLENLRRLDLSHNKIGTINSSMFTGLPKLEKLLLSYNRINTIPEGTFNDLTSLRRIDFNSEYLRCDCHLRWMVKWSKSKKVRIHPSTVCALPDVMKGLVFNKLKRSDLHCNHDLQLPYFEISPTEAQIVFEGDKLPFECRATVIHSKTKISWIRKGVVVETNKNAGVFVHTIYTPDRTMVTHSLAVENLQKSHTGLWSCQVSTPQGKVSRDVQITVIKNAGLQCPEVTKITNKGNYTWEKTFAGFKIEKQCTVGSEFDHATYFCNDLGYWENLNISACGYISDTTRIFQRLAQENINISKVSEYISRLSMTLNLPKPVVTSMSVMDVVFMADILEKLQNMAASGADISEYIVEVISNLTTVSETILRGAQLQKRACSRVVAVLENITQEVNTESSQNVFSCFAANIAIMVFKSSASSESRRHCRLLQPQSKENIGYSDKIFSCSQPGNDTEIKTPRNENIHASVDLPATLLKDAGEQNSAKVNIQVTVFRTASLFPKTSSVHSDPSLGSRNWTVVSNVISASIGRHVSNLTDPVTLSFEVPDSKATIAAAYWDVDANGGLGDWKTDGCEIVSKAGNITVVICYHLSNFAILQDHSILYLRRSFMMEPIIYVGSCVCMLCMMAVIITYVTCFRLIYIPKKMKHSVINICISILMLIVAFTMGINRTDLELMCQIAGIGIHYLTLCAIFWITITSNNMFKKFTKAERPPSPPPEPVSMPLPPKPILRFYFLGWGVPIIICGITAAVNFNHYSGMEYCFLDWEPSLGAFYGPVALLVILNLIFFMRISCVIRGTPNNLNETDETEEMHVNEIELVPNQADTNLETQSLTQLHDNDDDAASSISILDQERRPITQLRALVATLFLFIVVWVCGAFAVAKPFKSIIPYQEVIFSYLYGLMSSVLGIFMVGYFCLTRRDSRLSWKRFFGCGSQPPLYSYPVNTDPPTQVTQVNGNVVKSGSNMDLSTTYSQKSSNITKAYNMKNNPNKQSNINLVPVPNSSKEGSVSSNQESFPNFYNPRQNGAAKKFWEKNRHNTHSKIMNKDVNRDINESIADNVSSSEVRRFSQGTSSDANTHLSIEIQIQTKEPGRMYGHALPQGLEPSQGTPLHVMNHLPLNINHGPTVFNRPPMDRNHMTPVGGARTPEQGTVSPCCSLVSPTGSQLLPHHQRTPSACSLGTGSHPSAFTPVQPRNNTLPKQIRPVATPSSPSTEFMVRDGSVPRLRDFDGQSQVSDSCEQEPSQKSNMPILPSHVIVDRESHPENVINVSSPYVGSGVCYNNHKNYMRSPSHSRPTSGEHVHSPNCARPPSGECVHNPSRARPPLGERKHSPNRARPQSGEYSSDSSRHRGHKRNISQNDNVRTNTNGSKSPVMSDSQSYDRFLSPDSDGQVPSRRQQVNESDHHSDPTHRKRHRSHDKYSKHRGMQKQRSLGWEEQFKDRPSKIAYAYVNHSYQEKVLHKLITQASESDELAKKAFWLPRSMSEYDRLTQTGFCDMVEDSSSSSEDDESFDNVWVPQTDSGDNAFKKETSV